MSKQSLFNDALEELIDSCVDYREAEHPASGQGSWAKSQMYAVVLRNVRDVVDLVNEGAGGQSSKNSRNHGTCSHNGRTQVSSEQAPCICDDPAPALCSQCTVCNGVISNG